MSNKKTAIVLGVVLGVVILAVAIYVFWPKDNVLPEQPDNTSESLFDVSIFDMDRGYINDNELIDRIRIECAPYADQLTMDTTFYTNDGIELYTILRPDRYTEVRVYLNLDEDIIEYDVRYEVPEYEAG